MRRDSDDLREKPIWDGIYELRDIAAGVFAAVKRLVDVVELVIADGGKNCSQVAAVFTLAQGSAF